MKSIWLVDNVVEGRWVTQERYYDTPKQKSDFDLHPCKNRRNAHIIYLSDPLPPNTIILNSAGDFWYQKLGYEKWDWWTCLNSTFPVETWIDRKLVDFYPEYENKKPLYRDGKLNRFGFKWTDLQVINHYSNILHI